MVKTNTSANIGFEKELWDAADSLRGHISAADYRKVIIGLIFLKYVSDSFTIKYNYLLKEDEGFEEDRDEYVSENKSLVGVLPKVYATPDLDKRVLGEVVDIFTNINMFAHGNEKDLLGRTYEYCLEQFAAYEGKNGGEFYTPTSIVKTIVEILKPFNGRVYDPACGFRVIIMTVANSSVKSKVLKLLPKLKTEETDSLCVA